MGAGFTQRRIARPAVVGAATRRLCRSLGGRRNRCRGRLLAAAEDQVRIQRQPAISKHLKVLERAGLVSLGRDAQRRPRRLEAKPLEEANEWLERYRRFWEDNFQRLDALFDEMKTAQKKRGRTKR